MHQDLLLKTKLYVPRGRSDLVPRPRLIQRLNAGLARKLTLVSAPAGSGKTTLVSEWVRHYSAATAWLTLDAGDNDLSRFAAYLVAALQTLDADIGEPVQALLQSSPPPSAETMMTALINEIVALAATREGRGGSFILVLDDYHLIEAPATHQAVSFLLDNMPPPQAGMHLIITSRTEPLLPLSRLRVRGQLAELGPSDLRFSIAETTELLNQVMGFGLSAQDVAALDSRTEGWIAGLQLASLALQGTLSTRGTQALPGFVKAFAGSHRHVLDYLADEVLDRQPEHIQTFLLQTSILDYLTSSLCDAVCIPPGDASDEPAGQTKGGSQAILEMLDRANLFVIPLDDERRWYRYHPLFSDLLRHRLEQEMSHLVPSLHSRACEWYAHSGRVYEAMGHALSAGDVDRAARLVEETDSATMTLRGEATTLLQWLDALPDDVVRTRPQLSLSRAWAAMVLADVDALELYVQDALYALGFDDADSVEWPESLSPQTEGFLGEANALRAFVAVCREEPQQAIVLAQQALQRLPHDNLVRGAVGSMVGDAYRQTGNVTAAHSAYSQALADCQEAGHDITAMIATNDLALLYIIQGQLYRAAESYESVLEWGEGRRQSRYPAERAIMGLGDLYREWNQLEVAERHLTEGIRRCELGGYARYLIFGYTSLARVRAALGDENGAVELLQKGARVAKSTGMGRYASQVGAHRARLWLSSTGANQAAAQKWVRDSGLSAADQPTYARETEYLTLVRVLIAISRERPPESLAPAMGLLQRLLAEAETGGRTGSVIEVLVLQSLALEAQRDMDRAIPVLERALALAEPEGYVRLFVDEGGPMAALLRQTAALGISLDYVGRLLSAFGESDAMMVPSHQQIVDPLTTREQQVLRLLAVGMSNREIALELSVALNTVKTHARRIYGKLDAGNRTEAVANARQLGLL